MVTNQPSSSPIPAGSNTGIYQQGASLFASLSEKIESKIERVLNSLAFGNQFHQIEVIRKELPAIAILKKEILENHIKTVSNFNKISLGLRLVIEKINIIKRKTICVGIHPTIDAHTFEKVPNEWFYASNVLENEERIDIFTKDHQLLDARMIYADKEKDKNKLTVVWFTGNQGYLANSIREARKVAEDSNVNVLLYNPRGVGLSLGTEYNLEEAVEDGKAVIKHALENLCENDSERLGVYGLSLGGGISAAALNELQDEKVIDKIALYINHQSFSSLQHCVKGLTNIPAIITRVALAILRINPLNTGRSLTKTTLADETIVLTGECDEMMKGVGRLEDYLKKNPTVHTSKISYLIQPNASHCDPISPDIFKRKNKSVT